MQDKPSQLKHKGFYGWLNRTFDKVDELIGPNKQKYKPACVQEKDIFLDCVMKSDCFKQTEDFVHCAQDGISKECKALRYNYFMCKRSQIFWAKSFTSDDPRRV